MKPIIIILNEGNLNKDGKYELSDQELRTLLQEAYEQGFEDARKQYQPSINGWGIRDIPCDNYTTGQPNQAVKLNGSAVSSGV